MSSDAEAPQQAELAFARTLGLFDATMIGVGAMIGAGIFVLTGIAAGVSGPASILAFALNGAVTLLTASPTRSWPPPSLKQEAGMHTCGGRFREPWDLRQDGCFGSRTPWRVASTRWVLPAISGSSS